MTELFLTSVTWYVIVVLICIFLVMSDVEYLFMCLLPSLCLLWRNVCLGLLSTFWLGCFSCWVVWAACIFWKLILCQLFHLLFFLSHSEGCLFTLFIVSFAVQKLLSLLRFHLSFPGGSNGRKLAYSTRDLGMIPGSGGTPYSLFPVPVFFPGEFHEQRGCISPCVPKSWTWLSDTLRILLGLPRWHLW